MPSHRSSITKRYSGCFLVNITEEDYRSIDSIRSMVTLAQWDIISTLRTSDGFLRAFSSHCLFSNISMIFLVYNQTFCVALAQRRCCQFSILTFAGEFLIGKRKTIYHIAKFEELSLHQESQINIPSSFPIFYNNNAENRTDEF